MRNLQRKLASFGVALVLHAGIVLMIWQASSTAIEPLKDVSAMMTLVTTQPAVQPESVITPDVPSPPVMQVKPQQQVQPLSAPAAPRKAIAERKAHKAVAPKAQPSVPASTGESPVSPVPVAEQSLEATRMPESSPQQASGVALTASVSTASVKDIANAYRAMVHGRIAALQAYPSLARRMGEEGTVLVRFTILASGKIYQVDIVESSGYESLDVAAVAIFTRELNGQLPPIPAELNKTEWVLSLPIRYQLQ